MGSQSNPEQEMLHRCDICGLHYIDGTQAARCKSWCEEHPSCNLEITAQAVERNVSLAERQFKKDSR